MGKSGSQTNKPSDPERRNNTAASTAPITHGSSSCLLVYINVTYRHRYIGLYTHSQIYKLLDRHFFICPVVIYSHTKTMFFRAGTHRHKDLSILFFFLLYIYIPVCLVCVCTYFALLGCLANRAREYIYIAELFLYTAAVFCLLYIPFQQLSKLIIARVCVCVLGMERARSLFLFPLYRWRDPSTHIV